MFFGAVPPSLVDAVLDESWSSKLGLDYKRFMSAEEWMRNMKVAMRDALVIVNAARLTTAKENMVVDAKYRVVRHEEGSLVNVVRPITKKGETSRLLYQAMGPFEVLRHNSPPNSDGSYNVYRLKHLGTGREAAYHVKDIIPYISKQAYEQEKEEIAVEAAEEETEVLENAEFDPQVGDFLLFPNFGNVKYHLIRVMSRPFEDEIKFCYYGVPKSNKKRLNGFQQVWTHPTKPEVQQNAECKLKDYAAVQHDLPLNEVCQKVIKPDTHVSKGRLCFKLKAADVKDVLRYAPMS